VRFDRRNQRPFVRANRCEITAPLREVHRGLDVRGGQIPARRSTRKIRTGIANARVYAGIYPRGEVIYEPVRRQVTLRDITRHTVGFSSRKR
jgi:hypothetical protein